MEILKYLEAKIGKEDFKELKLVSANYSRADELCSLVFVYPDKEESTPKAELVKQIEDSVREYLHGICKIELKFKKSFLDASVVKNMMLEYLSKNYAVISYGIDETKIAVNVLNEEVQVTISCNSSVGKFIKEKNVLQYLSKEFNGKFFQIFTFEIQEIAGQEECLLDILKEQDIAEREALGDIVNELQVHKINGISKLFGKDIAPEAMFIDDVKSSGAGVVVAGKIKFFEARRFKPKNPKENEVNSEREFYSFSLEDPSGSINIVHFPTQATQELIKQLANNVEIAVCGTVERYNERLSMRAQDISFCKLPGVGKKINWRQEPEKYSTVIPQAYIEKEQLGLFDEVSATKPYLLQNTVVVFDFETTGLSSLADQIIEIGAVKIKEGRIVETFSTLINPEMLIPPDATQINKITNEMVASAPTLEKVLPDFYKFTRGAVLSAYNIGFDYGFLRAAGIKHRFNFENEQLDTMVLAREKLRNLHNYKLATAAKALGVSLDNAHRALDDTIATAKIFIKLV